MQKKTHSKAWTPTSVLNFLLIALRARQVSRLSSSKFAHLSRSTNRSIVSAELGPLFADSLAPKTETKLPLKISIFDKLKLDEILYSFSLLFWQLTCLQYSGSFFVSLTQPLLCEINKIKLRQNFLKCWNLASKKVSKFIKAFEIKVKEVFSVELYFVDFSQMLCSALSKRKTEKLSIYLRPDFPKELTHFMLGAHLIK